jgi:predicted RNA-binding protein associated with RNAse of E/G family
LSCVTIHYTRPPERTTTFRQRFIAQEGPCTITLMERTPLLAPVCADGHVVLEDGAPAVWFTFADAWHDIGRFHLAGGRFTGWYANILTPVEFLTPSEWATTDLCLDVWLGADGTLLLLDEDELRAAVAAGAVSPDLARGAGTEAARLVALARAGDWPPRIAREWTLERALEVLARGTRTNDMV